MSGCLKSADRKYLGNGWPNEEQMWLLRAILFSGSSAEEAWSKWIARIDFDKIDVIRGLDICITTSAKTNEEAKALLEAFNLPLKDRDRK